MKLITSLIVVAILTAFYVAAAVLPWIGILYVWVS